MQRWEYRIADKREQIEIGPRQLLGRLGEQGWELVCDSVGGLVFKRPVEPPPERHPLGNF